MSPVKVTDPELEAPELELLDDSPQAVNAAIASPATGNITMKRRACILERPPVRGGVH
jgi:hypothetical protein